jgi:hypothetical protein
LYVTWAPIVRVCQEFDSKHTPRDKIQTEIINQEPTGVPSALQLIVVIEVIHPTAFKFPTPRTFGAKFRWRIVLGHHGFV